MSYETSSQIRSIRFVHLSDLHYVGAGDHSLSTDTRSHLQQVVRALRQWPTLPAFLLVSGDLTDGGKIEDYRELKQELAALQVPILLALGNHDDLDSFAEVFGACGSSADHATVIEGLHVITLDSHVPQQVYGDLRQEQLDWLKTELARFPELPKVVQIHHPPVFGKAEGSPDEWHHLTAQASEALRMALSGYRILGLFSGHVHTDQFTLWQGLPCFSSAGLNNTTDATFTGGLRALRAASFNVCTVSGHDLRVSAVPLLALDDELFILSAEQLQRFNPTAPSPSQKENV